MISKSDQSKEKMKVLRNVLLGLSLGISAAILFDNIVGGNGRAIGPILAAVVAILIAFVGYPWQKAKDRQLELDRERRAYYREFVTEWFEMETDIISIAKKDELPIHEMFREIFDVIRRSDFLAMQAAMYADETVVRSISEAHYRLYQRINDFKDELAGQPETPAQEMKERLVDHLSRKEPEDHKIKQDLINSIRNELGLAGQFSVGKAVSMIYR